ncbi:unnamed protein product [Meganyctiphanes norvegica]|uniref:Coiled-coil domain-containing protein 130 n=1 Tax=Meganyctiphanes norvegica TaxID=48144 RepID=A0AAV2QKV7_MEGNR
MGERKGVNKYYPPDYDPSKGGLNKFQGTHALRERAKKLHLGILIIRFEMPYNIWCEGCENHIGTGVRYNAEKTKVGMYYSTPIYNFRMKCHLCDSHFEIKTDPANLDYVIVNGARRQERRWDPTENEQVVPEDKAINRKMAVDSMFKLEHGVSDKEKTKEATYNLQNLEQFQDSRWKNDFAANQVLRNSMRAKRKEEKAQAARDSVHNLSVPLLPANDEDAKIAALLQFTQPKSPEKLREERKAIIDAQSVFSKLKTKKISPAAKREYARSQIKELINSGQKNFSNIKKVPGLASLGIIPKNAASDEPLIIKKKICLESNKSMPENSPCEEKIYKHEVVNPLKRSSNEDSVQCKDEPKKCLKENLNSSPRTSMGIASSLVAYDNSTSESD